MPATPLEKQRLRLETGDDSASLPDADLDALFEIAEADYAGYGRAAQYAFARLLRRQSLLAQARKQVDYSANESSEKLSQIAAGLESDVARDMDVLSVLIAQSRPAFGVGKSRRVPPRQQETPHDEL